MDILVFEKTIAYNAYITIVYLIVLHIKYVYTYYINTKFSVTGTEVLIHGVTYGFCRLENCCTMLRQLQLCTIERKNRKDITLDTPRTYSGNF